jgi:arylsulfatase
MGGIKKSARNLVLACGLAAAAFSAPEERPNIVFMLADDMGWSDLGCYGGEIDTPNLDRLAEHGVRFSQFYNSARCWPSRTALMTGYYPEQHEYNKEKPSYTRTLPYYLHANGYRSYFSGKWHIKSGFSKVMAEARFERSYQTKNHNQYFIPGQAELDDQPIEVDSGPEYYETDTQVDYALRFLDEHERQTPDQPFFLYLAFIAPHFPLQARPQDLEKYRNRYAAGWDVIRRERYERMRGLGLVDAPLPERMTDFRNIVGGNMPEEELKRKIGPGETGRNVLWADLTAEEQAFQAQKMSIHAAMIDRLDQEVGRVIDWLEERGLFENTLILFASDNGASSETLIRGGGHNPSAPPGSAETFLCLGPGWACTANTPLRYSKGYVHEGGISSPFIAHWPNGIADHGAIRRTPAQLVDVLPTLAAVSGGLKPELIPPEAPPFPGRNLLPAFKADVAVDRDALFFAHVGNEALRVGDWKIVHVRGGEWELYNLAEDRTETADLAAAYPEKLQEMIRHYQSLRAGYIEEAKAHVATAAKAPSAPAAKAAAPAKTNKSAASPKSLGEELPGGQPLYDFSGRQVVRMGETPELTFDNTVCWSLDACIDEASLPNAVMLGNRILPDGSMNFFKITPERGVQLFSDGKKQFSIPVKFPRSKWIRIEVVKTGPAFRVLLDGKEVGSASMREPAPAMPCYLGGDPLHGEFFKGQIRNVSVQVD